MIKNKNIKKLEAKSEFCTYCGCKVRKDRMAFNQDELQKIRRSALSIVSLISRHADNSAEKNSGETFDYITGDVEDIHRELESLSGKIDWDAILKSEGHQVNQKDLTRSAFTE